MNNFIFSLRMLSFCKANAIFHFLTHELHSRLTVGSEISAAGLFSRKIIRVNQV